MGHQYMEKRNVRLASCPPFSNHQQRQETTGRRRLLRRRIQTLSGQGAEGICTSEDAGSAVYPAILPKHYSDSLFVRALLAT